MPKLILAASLLMFTLGAAGCNYQAPSVPPPATSGQPTPGSVVHDQPIPPAAAKARQALAARVGVSASAIVMLKVIEMDWPDACLGLADAAEVCAQVITPGYEVVMLAGTTEYVYRTNRDGTAVRVASVVRITPSPNGVDY